MTAPSRRRLSSPPIPSPPPRSPCSPPPEACCCTLGHRRRPSVPRRVPGPWDRASAHASARIRDPIRELVRRATSSTGSCGSSVQGPLGGMGPSGSVRGPRCTPAFAGRRRTGRSSGCSTPPRRRRRQTRPATSTGWCRSAPLSPAPTSTPPEPEKGAPQPGPRTLSRRPDQQDSSGLRRRGISHTIPERADQVRSRLNRGGRGGRPPAFDRDAYKRRDVVNAASTD